MFEPKSVVARIESNIVAFDRSTESNADVTTGSGRTWPNPHHPLAFQLAMALVEKTEYGAA